MKLYKNDEDKLKVYNHYMLQAEAQFKGWKDVADRAWRRYQNEHNIDQVSGGGHVVNVPTLISIIDAMYSSMTAADVDFMVAASGKGTSDQAFIASEALSKEWNQSEALSEAEMAIKDALLTGIGWAKVGYEYDEEVHTVPRPDEHIAHDRETLTQEAIKAGIRAPSADQIAEAVPLTEDETTVLRDRVVVDYVPWELMRWDPTAKRIKDIHWHCQISFLDPEEVKNNPSFREYVKRTRGSLKKLDDLKADTKIEFDVGSGAIDYKPERENPLDRRCTVYELWDYATGNVCTFVKNADFLLNEQPNPFMVNLDRGTQSPFVPLVLRATSTRVRGISEAEVLDGTLKEMDLHRSRLATYVERTSPKYVAPARMFTENAKNALKSQEYGVIVEVEEEFQDRTDLFQPIKLPELPSEMFGMPEKLEQEARDATGVNELMRGLFPDRKRTATETAEVVTASAARQAEKRTQLERFYRAIGTRILQLMQMFYTQERMLNFVAEGITAEWSYTADDIIFESSLEVSLTPKESKSWTSRRDDAMAVLNVVGPFAQAQENGETVVKPEELLQWALGEMGVKRADIAKFIASPADKQQAQMAAQQQAAGMASAAAGQPRPDMTTGPLSDKAVAAGVNQGALPPETLAASLGAVPGVTPEATQELSNTQGMRGPGL